MTDDIVARLRVLAAEFPTFNGIMDSEWTHAADEIERLRKERDEARRRTNSILTEIDCRIEHGAESNGHLEVLRDMFKENTDE
jgi:hypothetical protein